jgi:hypothetical protein
MNSRSVFSVLLAVGLGAVGCNPRGETNSLSDVAGAAELRFSRAYDSSEIDKTESASAASLRSVVDSLKVVGGAGSAVAADRYQQLGRSLDELATYAGYTSRPAIGELSEQWLGLEAAANAPSTRLLVSRTFGVLASELEGVGFAIRP